MTPRERFFAALEGREVDCYPVFAPYTHLSNADHWTEVTGRPLQELYRWQNLSPDEHARGYDPFWRQMPFDVFEPWNVPRRRADREATIIELEGSAVYQRDRRTGLRQRLPDDTHTGGSDGAANEERLVSTREDVDRKVEIVPAAEQVANGSMDYLRAGVDRFVRDHFVLGGGIVNSFYGCTYYVGLTNRLMMYLDEPELIEYLSERYLAANLERIRAFALAGSDAVWIDDATATSDMVSLAMFDRFSLPYLRPLVKEIQRLGMKCILIYFGGIADRVEQILSTEPDGLVMEASMKGYVNDIATIARQIDGRTCLFGNLNPFDDVERLSEKELHAKMRAQFRALRPYRRLVTSTGSPLTPRTTVSRIRRYIQMAHELRA